MNSISYNLYDLHYASKSQSKKNKKLKGILHLLTRNYCLSHFAPPPFNVKQCKSTQQAMFKFLEITTLKPNHAKNSTPLPNGSQLTRNESTKINFASNKCQGQNKDTIMRQLDLTNKELIDEQKLNDFIV